MTPAPGTGIGQSGTGLIAPDTATGSVLQTLASTATAGPPAPPEAATLAWLSGAATADGILLDTAAGKRWQGTVPGSYALLGDHGYEWFGPDGSMVGCAATGACVGVDGDGNVAVATSHRSARLVYGADGRVLGQFTAGGERMSTPAEPPTLQRALSDSGVDVAGLVSTATLGAPFAGGATGDPHLITAGGVRLTTQVVGQFVARGGDPAHAIQLEFAPMAHREDVSVVSAVAIGAGKDTVIVTMAGALTIDGSIRPPDSAFDQMALDSGAVVGRWPADSQRVVTVAVVWPGGGSVVMAANPALGITVVAHLRPLANVVGLFGAGGQGVGPDLLARGGTSEGTEKTVSSWSVGSSERLFESTPDAAPTFPTQKATLDPGAQQMADQACNGQGMRHAEDVATCVFDVALTGDTGFVAGHVELAEPAEHGKVAAAFGSRWPALLPGTVLGAPDLPSDGALSLTVAPAKSRAVRIKLDRAGAITLVNRNGCATGESPPGIDQPAMRLFDIADHPVSDRLALCGHQQTPTLPAGSYNLVVANGPSTAELSVRVDVTLP